MNAPANIQTVRAIEAGGTVPLRPLDLAIVVVQGFSHLALHAYIEPFRIANTLSPVPLFRCQIAGLSDRPVIGANGLAIAVDTTTEDLSAANCNGFRFDHLVIVAGEPVHQQLTPQLNAFLRSVARRGISISAIGTASWLLAESGLLGDTRCTIHWSRLAAFSEIFHRPRIRDSLFVKDGQYSTCAGELAAFDLAVDLIGSHAGVVIAQEVCRHATVDGQRSGSNRQTGPSGLAFAGVSEKLVAAMQVMEENVEVPLTMDEVAKVVGISRRQLERLFATHIGITPVRHYLKIRVDRARRLVEGTRMPLIEVAIACGFVSASHFSKCFRVIHGITPQQCRLALPAWVGPGLDSC
ncbi:GlxA family transcriptional regulator [Mesorhizobium sp. M1300]|uniref:GlxA family transcriptional regulator n=1 Tax=Mesorhizobium sp. M1300 TaxID=2957077 RepID=UPI003338ED62